MEADFEDEVEEACHWLCLMLVLSLVKWKSLTVPFHLIMFGWIKPWLKLSCFNWFNQLSSDYLESHVKDFLKFVHLLWNIYCFLLCAVTSSDLTMWWHECNIWSLVCIMFLTISKINKYTMYAMTLSSNLVAHFCIFGYLLLKLFKLLLSIHWPI